MKTLTELLVHLLATVPDAVVGWAYPRLLKAQVEATVEQYGILPHILGKDLVEGFAPGTVTAPAQALRTLIEEALTFYGVTLTGDQLSPFMVALGQRLITDYTP